jgi:hypothetical protein
MELKPLCQLCSFPEYAHPHERCAKYVSRLVPKTHCDTCKRRLWDGGHALSPEECDRPDGENCLLNAAVGRMAKALNDVRKTEQEWAEGLINRGERENRLQEAVRVGLDESIPAGSVFLASWCGGEDSAYARLFRDCNRLLKERDEAVKQHENLRLYLNMYKDQWRRSIEKDGRQIHEAFKQWKTKHLNDEVTDVRAELEAEQKRSAALMELVQAFVHCDYTGEDAAPVAARARKFILEDE